MDALRPGYAPGRQGEPPDTWLYGGLLVSYDPVALDSAGRDILLEKLREANPEAAQLDPPVTYLDPACQRYHLGECDPAKIEVVTIGPDSGWIRPESMEAAPVGLGG